MTKLIQISVLLGMVLTATSAQAAINNRAECYTAVITHCNTTKHPEACANGGLPQCDAQFPKEELPPTSRGMTSKTN